MVVREVDRSGPARLPDLDRSVPALLLKLGEYPLHHGGVGVVRSLGRCGVEVHAVTEGRFTPAALSRHLRGRVSWSTTGSEEPAELLDRLLEVGRALGRPSVLVPTDDEAAVVVAELADQLDGPFLVPRMRWAAASRELASKEGLHAICRDLGIPTPATVFPERLSEIEEYAAQGRFPVVIKSRAAFERHDRPTVRSSTVVRDADELRRLADGWSEPLSLVLQEYIPRADAEDWFVHASTGPDGEPGVVFTGVKVRSWPPHAGVTSYGLAVWNPALADRSSDLFRRLGFAGIADLDWRYDRRDGQYKLLDFNPRVGAQFRLFEDGAGIDVVRAQHLTLTGREVPEGAFPEGRRFILEDLDLRSRFAYRHEEPPAPHAGRPATATEFAWLSLDDPLPVLPLLIGRAAPAVHRLRRALHLTRPGEGG